MDNSILTAFAVCSAVGLGAFCLPRFVAPSDTYIMDVLQPATEITTESFEFTTQPQDFTAVEGEDVSFGVATNRYSTVVSYQWQYSTGAEPVTFTDIPTATYAVYNFVCDNTHNGYLYRCVCTSEGQTIVSDEALLSVLPSEPVTTTTMILGGVSDGG